MEKSRVLRLQTLNDNGACAEQAHLFKHMFGESVRVTPALCVKHAQLFDWVWARRLLSAQAREAYNKACAQAGEAYNKARAQAWDVCDKARARAGEAYVKACAQAREACDKACAQAWAEAYINDVKGK